MEREQNRVITLLLGTHVFQNQNINKAQVWERY